MAKRHIPPIVNGQVTLRLLEEADLPLTRAWRNQDDIRKWFLTSAVISAEQHAAWFAQYRERDDDFVFVIEETATLKCAVGQVSLYAIEWDRRRSKLGRLLIGDAEARGKGLARRAVETLIDFAERLGLEELRLEVLAGNEPAIAIYEACGFAVHDRQEGELRMVRASGRGRPTT